MIASDYQRDDGCERMKWRREEKLEFGPQPAKKLLTTKGLIIRGIIFLVSVSMACYLIWQEFSR
jgi:hypothetical protein